MSNKAKIREAAKKLNPIDDIMFRKMADDIEFCQEILRVILSDENLIVLERYVQWTGNNLKGRSVILDLMCLTGDDRHINVEVQKSDNDDHQRRVRYNGAILTTNTADPGIKFEQVPDVCVIFISKFDIFKGNRAVYHVDRVVRETNAVVDNGFEEIYVNAEIRDGSDVSELMKIFVENDVYNSNKFPKVSELKRMYKETEEGLKAMNGVIESLFNDIFKDELEEERKEGRKEGILISIENLMKNAKCTAGQAMDSLGIPEAEQAFYAKKL